MDVIRRQFTVDEIYQMLDSGILKDGERLELIDGKLLTKSPHDPAHSDSVQDANGLLVRAFGPGYYVRVQLPLELSNLSEPEPDFAVVTKQTSRGERHPSTALLVAEVSNTSLHFDRNRKASLHANAGIPEYWIINVLQAQIEVHRLPTTGGYSEVTILQIHDEV
ncbi:unnamed protein product, partial [Phaeothamnion confervicola]